MSTTTASYKGHASTVHHVSSWPVEAEPAPLAPAPVRRKTELCNALLEYGSCPYGNRCTFAHGDHELRQPNSSKQRSTVPCRSYVTTGHCYYGRRCRFDHSVLPWALELDVAKVNPLDTRCVVYVEDLFADELNDMLGSALENAINTGMEGAPWHNGQTDGIVQDMRPVPPGFNIMPGFVGIQYTGYMYPETEGLTLEDWDRRTKPAPLPSIINDADVQMIVSNSVFDSLFSVANYESLLQGTISPDTVANPMFESYLSTSVLASMCPEVYAQYPSSGVSLEMSASIDPTLTFMPSAGFLNITGTVDVSVNSDPASD
eukprot:g10913.t1